MPSRSGPGITSSAIYDRLDACLASGAQWNYTPRWNAQTKDGWNAEDFNILDPSGTLRPNFRPRPYPRRPRACRCDSVTRIRDPAGHPCGFEFDWNHDPDRGETEIFVPNALFPAGTIVEVDGQWRDLASRSDAAGPRLPGRDCHDDPPEGHGPGQAGRLAAGRAMLDSQRRTADPVR